MKRIARKDSEMMLRLSRLSIGSRGRALRRKFIFEIKFSQMKIIIEQPKITDYLLVWKQKNDKSKFLNDLGYSIQN